jgi:TRAP-type C4-dicarboxylate transport system permease large subunit
VGLGFFIEGMAMMFIAIPLFVPAAVKLNISLIHLGVIFCISVLIAGVTPPVSTFLYATAGMFDVRIDEIVREVLPFLVVMIIVLFIVVLFPGLSLLLPGTM